MGSDSRPATRNVQVRELLRKHRWSWTRSIVPAVFFAVVVYGLLFAAFRYRMRDLNDQELGVLLNYQLEHKPWLLFLLFGGHPLIAVVSVPFLARALNPDRNGLHAAELLDPWIRSALIGFGSVLAQHARPGFEARFAPLGADAASIDAMLDHYLDTCTYEVLKTHTFGDYDSVGLNVLLTLRSLDEILTTAEQRARILLARDARACEVGAPPQNRIRYGGVGPLLEAVVRQVVRETRRSETLEVGVSLLCQAVPGPVPGTDGRAGGAAAGSGPAEQWLLDDASERQLELVVGAWVDGECARAARGGGDGHDAGGPGSSHPAYVSNV